MNRRNHGNLLHDHHQLDDPWGNLYERRDRVVQKESFLKGWSASGKLVVGANKTGLGSTVGSVDVVPLAVNFKHPNTYTLQFFTDALAHPNPSGVPIYTLAEVIWSVSGSSVRRLCSILNGTSLSGSGEGVTVKIYDWSANSLVKSTYTVSVLLSPGIRGSYTNPPFLEIDNELLRGGTVDQTVAAGGNTTWQIPQNAGVNSVFLSANNFLFAAMNDNDFSITQRGPVSGQKVANGRIFNTTWWPVSSGATEVRIFNNSAALIDVTPSWGIEG